jgi:inosine triphosphate pyrophosphatase
VHILGNEFNLENSDVDCKACCDVVPELQGEALEIAKEKVMVAYNELKKPVVVEDTSLCYNAYKGLPGPYIKWFLKSIGPEGLAKMVSAFEDKSAYAMCIIAYMGPELKEPELFVGKTPGKIVEPRGPRDFGWDPVFEPDGYDQTYAELPKEIKNKISHRYRAIDLMREYFKTH